MPSPTFARPPVDPRRHRARREGGPFGTTVAHGNLTLSLIDYLRPQLFRQEGVTMGVNLGWNRVRFPAPVLAGSRIRAGRGGLGRGQGQRLGRGGDQFTIEREGEEKPVCVADSVGRALVAWAAPTSRSASLHTGGTMSIDAAVEGVAAGLQVAQVERRRPSRDLLGATQLLAVRILDATSCRRAEFGLLKSMVTLPAFADREFVS